MQEVKHRRNYTGGQRGNYDVLPASRKSQDSPPYSTPENKPKKSRRKLIIAVCITVIILVSAGVGGLLYLNGHKSPVPKNITKAVNFPVYYPSKIPAGYQLKKNSFNVENDVVFYTLSKEANIINVSEQAIPGHPPDLASIQGFKKLSTFAGDAAVGLNTGRPTAILLTNTTLLTVSGSAKVPQDIVVQTTQSMASSPD